jgi:predicted glutamine amidotransferase
MPSEKIIRQCFKNNPDGAGYMFPYRGKVKIIKGFTTVKSLLQSLKELKKKHDVTKMALVIHFRIGTSGKKSKENTHPFPIANTPAELKKLQNLCDRAMCHNGILSDFTTAESELSDTMHFVKTLTSCNTDEQIRDELRKHAGQKFVLMTAQHVYTFGYFTKHDGIEFSNDGFKTIVYKTIEYIDGAGLNGINFPHQWHYKTVPYRRDYDTKDFDDLTDGEKEQQKRFKEYLDYGF